MGILSSYLDFVGYRMDTNARSTSCRFRWGPFSEIVSRDEALSGQNLTWVLEEPAKSLT